jgi:hypothetical protein
MVAGVTFSDPANTFNGMWTVEEGFLKGAGLGQSSFLIQKTGYLDLDADYDNTNATLVVEVNPTNSAVGGTFLLDQNVTLGDVYLYGVALADGTYTAAELIANPAYGNAIDPASTGTLTVVTSALPEIGDVSSSVVGSDLVMGWNGSSRATYTVQTKQDLVIESEWTDEPGYINIPGIDGLMSVTNTIAIEPTKFYRIIGNK